MRLFLVSLAVVAFCTFLMYQYDAMRQDVQRAHDRGFIQP